MDTENVMVRNVDRDKKTKARYILLKKGTTLSEAIREMIDSLANEFDENFGNK